MGTAAGRTARCVEREPKRGMMGVPADLRSLPERILVAVHPEPNTGCWLFAGYLDRDGYGRIMPSRWSSLKRRPMAVHRVMYEHIKGLIPDNLTIDHKCRIRCCCNPEHMEPVPNVTNVMRGISIFAQNARKEKCKRGHPLSGDNLYVTKRGFRNCRTCGRDRYRLAALRKVGSE